MDRINLIVDVRRSEAAKVLSTGTGTSSAQLKEGVMQARAYASWRQTKEGRRHATRRGAVRASACKKHEDTLVASKGTGAALLASCQLSAKEQSYLETMADRFQLSGRGIMSALAVSRTIADMEESEMVTRDHLFESVTYRTNGFEG
jgi:magnesium chelatase family protein